MNKIAFITGITGQDASYLAELLLNKNYVVNWTWFVELQYLILNV